MNRIMPELRKRELFVVEKEIIRLLMVSIVSIRF